MKDKEKQIEEMVKDLKENLRLCAGVKLLDHQVETIAYELLKKYQPKLSEDSVVLSREEYEKLKTDNEVLGVELERTSTLLVNASKETAGKYNDKLVAIIQHLFDIGQIDFKAKIEFLKENEKILKQFGVEIKE